MRAVCRERVETVNHLHEFRIQNGGECLASGPTRAPPEHSGGIYVPVCVTTSLL